MHGATTGRLAILATVVGLAFTAPDHAADPPPLVLEAKIPLGAVAGRIDHFALDADRQILFVAELGNDSVGVLDLKERRVIRRLTGLSEPQGLAWLASTQTLYVANAGDGTVRLYQGADPAPVGGLKLGGDADTQVRLVAQPGRGRLRQGRACPDRPGEPENRRHWLKGHPESFQFDGKGSRIFVNCRTPAKCR